MSQTLVTTKYKAKRQRLLYNGKRVSKDYLVKQTVAYFLGDETKRQQSLGPYEIAKKMNRSPKQIYRYLHKAVQSGLLEKDGTKYKRPQQVLENEQFKRYDSNHDITKDPLVADWKSNLLTRKQGQKVVTWSVRISSLETVCNTMHKTPRQLLYMTHKEIESMMETFAFLLKDGKADIRKMKKLEENLLEKIYEIIQERHFDSELFETIKRRLEDWKKGLEDKHVRFYQIVQGLRDYLGFYGITWARGKGGIMSQKVPRHAQYGDVRLTSDELQLATQYIIERWGIDSDVYRWFWIGIESCARADALRNMTLEYVRHENKNSVTYIMEVTESKTKQIKGGKWTKYITRPETQQSIDALKNRGGFRIYETENRKKSDIKEHLKCSLIEIFLYLGKSHHYFYTHTNHVLRHIGAHYWLAKGNYRNHVIVAKIGGWNTVDEMIKSYGELPPEKVIEAVEDMNVD